MAVPYLTSETLIDSVKRRASVPKNQNTFTEADFLALANEEMIIGLIPSVLSLHEDYFLYYDDVPLEADVSEYDIPYRAIGNKLRDVQYVDTNNNLFEMTRITVGEEVQYQGTFTQNRAYAFSVRNNRVKLSPSVTGAANGSLRFWYYIRPSQLVAMDRVGIITGIDTVTGIITLNAFPDNFTTDILYDFYQVKSPHRPLSIDLAPTGIDIDALTVTFDPADVPSRLVVGDHLAQASEAIIPQVPSDLHMVLAHRVAQRILEAIGDSEGLQNATVKLAEMEMKTGNLIDNRVEDAPLKATNFNGLLKSGLHSRRYRRRGL